MSTYDENKSTILSFLNHPIKRFCYKQAVVKLQGIQTYFSKLVCLLQRDHISIAVSQHNIWVPPGSYTASGASGSLGGLECLLPALSGSPVVVLLRRDGLATVLHAVVTSRLDCLQCTLHWTALRDDVKRQTVLKCSNQIIGWGSIRTHRTLFEISYTDCQFISWTNSECSCQCLKS